MKNLPGVITVLKRLLVCMGISLLAGCSISKYADEIPLTRAELLSGTALYSMEITDKWLPQVDILYIDDDMRRFLEEHVPYSGSREHRLRLLLSAMLDQGLMNVEYDTDKTLTASETFKQKTGNCLSYTNLFVALAREVGLNVHYQQVEVPPLWTRNGDYVMLNRHINVVVNNDREHDYLVDFNLADYSGNYDVAVVDDDSAFAQYYSNVGVYYLKQGDQFSAFRYLKKALIIDSHQSAIWVNLGALYSRNDLFRYAEAAYLYALQENRRDHTANNNLAKLYEYRGEKEKADYYFNRAKYYREANPYYYLSLAKKYFSENQYQESIKNLKIALKKKEDEHLFYFWLGLNYYKLGEIDQAKAYFDKTLQHAYQPKTQELYKKKFELLFSAVDVS